MEKREKAKRSGTICKILALVAGISLLPSCGLVNTWRASRIQDDDELKKNATMVIISRAPVREEIQVWANKFALMSLFARVVYRNDLKEKGLPSNTCAYNKDQAEEDRYGMPQDSNRIGWQRFKGEHACFNEGGLYYETYAYYSAPEVIEEAVLAYRGTENSSLSEIWHDWGANLSAFLGLRASQYTLALEKLPKLVKELTDKNKNVKIYVTGHSLGGGLAQQAVYASNRIERAYAFDPSPVTNWSRLKLDGAIAKGAEDPDILRIYHKREILGYVRAITSRVNSRRFGRSDFEFHFQNESPGGAHNMAILACHFAARVAPSGAAHYYSREAAQSMLRNTYICPVSALIKPAFSSENDPK